MPERIKKSLILSIYFVLAVAALLVFWQVRNFDFVNYDDDSYVYANPHVLHGLTADSVRWAFTAAHASNWHPVTWLSLMLDCQLFRAASLPGGLNPGRMHLINVLFHLANTLLLFTVLKKMTGSLWPSAFVAALFALHPLHVESVAWISERKDVLSTFFWLLTMWAYVRYVKNPKLKWYLISLILFALGLMAKPMLVTLPFVFLLLDYWPFQRKISWRLLVEKIPFFALSAVSSIITFIVQRSGGAVNSINIISLNDRIANAFLSYAEYIYKMFWPTNLAVFYPLGASGSIPFWQAAACALMLLVISVFVIRFRRNQKYLPVGWFWFLATLIPVIGIVQVGSQAYADRYTYIPYIGLFIMIAWGLPQLLSKSPQRKIVLGLSMIIVLTALGICAHRQTSYWKNSISLFSHAIEVTKNNYLAYNNRGVAYNDLGRYADAIKDSVRALKFKPGYAMAYNNIGVAYGNLNRGEDEIKAYKRAIKFKPDYAEAYYNLGFAYCNLNRYTEAIDAYNQAVKINPDLAVAYSNLGVIYARLSRYADAVDAYKQAIKIEPDLILTYNNLGAAYENLNRGEDAINAFRQAIKIKPDCAEAFYNLARVFKNQSRWRDVIDAYKQAVKIKPDYHQAHYNLGIAYLTIGDKNSALAEYNILKTLNPQFADELLKEINK